VLKAVFDECPFLQVSKYLEGTGLHAIAPCYSGPTEHMQRLHCDGIFMSVSILCYIVHQILLLICVITQFIGMFFNVTCPLVSINVNTVYSGKNFEFFF